MKDIWFRTYQAHSGAMEYISLQELADGEHFDFNYESYYWMQYTNLRDKKGKDVYDGDIVLWKQADGGLLPPSENTHICEIKWIRNGWACEDIKPLKDYFHPCYTFSSSHMEVIGNIYQNPELLK